MGPAPWTPDEAINDFLATLELPPEPVVKQYMKEREPLEAAAPSEGEIAPAFSLEKLTAEGQRTGEQLSLADFSGKPLALLFGNYTCPIYRGQLECFSAAYAEFGDRMAFLIVYVKEEHPDDGWQLGINLDQCVVYTQPATADERAKIAADFVARYSVTIPMVMDDMNNTVCDLYAGSPERLYLLDESGVVVHRSPAGPFNMEAVDAWREALARI